MSDRIVVVDGHPSPDREHFVHALADRYAAGALSAGHTVRRIDIAALGLPPLGSRQEWLSTPPASVADVQADIAWCSHLTFFHPLWLGDMPALLKAFLEQVLWPGFAFEESDKGNPRGLLEGRSALLVVTMGMPAPFYRFVHGARSVKAFERNIVHMVEIRPTSHLLIGSVEASAENRLSWLDELYGLGEAGHPPVL